MKIVKNNIKLIIGIIIGVVISSISVYALTIASKDVSYDNINSGSESANVQGAIDELYEKVGSGKIDLLWTNPNPTSAFAAQTIALDLSKYDGIILQGTRDIRQIDSVTSSSAVLRYIEKGSGQNAVLFGNGSLGANRYLELRYVTVENNGVIFDVGQQISSTTDTMNDKAIPIKMWGVEGVLE